ncbi:glycosyltransferase [Janibacter sp. Soil728]|uniref:glycosyltransferase family 2 protein n=1 Tax=Janibacter sp. Soil728 TaxID=1736393 RepID=UPI0006F33FCE|nr:glycosyltransferase family 2 protein [Janibacter sp. Soil728]KRE35542.1 glycosyltransferase [Janibacter sp. Soil728]
MDDVLESATPAVEAIFSGIALPVLVYFLVINSSYLVLVVAAALEFRRSTRQLPFAGREELLGSGMVPSVSVVTAMFNEEAGIKVATQAMLALHYPRHEVIVVDDGSTDGGFEVLREAFDLVEVPRRMPADLPVREPASSIHVPRNGRTRLTVIRKPNSGRSDSLNVGVNFATQDLVVFVDSDSVLDPDALLAIVRPFAEDPVRVVAGGGVIRAINGCVVRGGRVNEVRMSRNWLARIQVVEYLRAFHLGRAGWSRLKSLILISGAFGIFRRDVLVEVGGLDPSSIGEDFELVLRVHKHMRRERRDYRVQFVSEPICWTEVPETATVLRKQRRRWHRGLWETLWAYRSMFLNPRYGKVGMIAIPYYWLFELLAPLLELFGLVLVVLGTVLGVVDVGYFMLFMAVAYGYAILVTLAAMTVEELSFHKYPRWRDLLSTLAAAVVENIGYRQATAVWRLEGWAQSLTGRKQEWGTMTRTGFDTSQEQGP